MGSLRTGSWAPHAAIGCGALLGLLHMHPPRLDTLVLSDGSSGFRWGGTCGNRCIEMPAWVPIEVFPITASAVVVVGHGNLQRYASLTPSALARRIASLRPQLVVMETCYGASEPLVRQLITAGVDARTWLVGSTWMVPRDGFRYGPDFFDSSDPGERALGVSTNSTRSLEYVQLDPITLAEATKVQSVMSVTEMKDNLHSVLPNYVAVSYGSGKILFDVAPFRFRAPQGGL